MGFFSKKKDDPFQSGARALNEEIAALSPRSRRLRLKSSRSLRAGLKSTALPGARKPSRKAEYSATRLRAHIRGSGPKAPQIKR